MRQKVAIPLGFIGGSTYHNFVGVGLGNGNGFCRIEQDVINLKKLTIQGIEGQRFVSYSNSLKVDVYFDNILEETIAINSGTSVNIFPITKIYEYDITNVSSVKLEFGVFGAGSSSNAQVKIREIKFE